MLQSGPEGDIDDCITMHKLTPDFFLTKDLPTRSLLTENWRFYGRAFYREESLRPRHPPAYRPDGWMDIRCSEWKGVISPTSSRRSHCIHCSWLYLLLCIIKIRSYRPDPWRSRHHGSAKVTSAPSTFPSSRTRFGKPASTCHQSYTPILPCSKRAGP